MQNSGVSIKTDAKIWLIALVWTGTGLVLGWTGHQQRHPRRQYINTSRRCARLRAEVSGCYREKERCHPSAGHLGALDGDKKARWNTVGLWAVLWRARRQICQPSYTPLVWDGLWSLAKIQNPILKYFSKYATQQRRSLNNIDSHNWEKFNTQKNSWNTFCSTVSVADLRNSIYDSHGNRRSFDLCGKPFSHGS